VIATSLTEVATRFAVSHPAMGTILVGMATPRQFEDALAAVQKGPLPAAPLGKLWALTHAFAAEPRWSLNNKSSWLNNLAGSNFDPDIMCTTRDVALWRQDGFQ
jgi:hypothetical protein